MRTFLAALLLIVGLLANAQPYQKQNINLLGLIAPNKDTIKSPVGNKYSGCWGWYQASKNKEYAISGASNGTYFIDVTAPTSPSVSAFVPGKRGCTWREMKTYQNYCYIVSDDGSPNKFTIVDMKYLPDSVHVVHNGTSYFERGHTIWIDNSKMYVGATTYTSGSSAMTVWSLATPTAPYLLRRVEQDIAPPVFSYVHDMFARNDTVYASTGWQGLHILKFNNSDTSFSELGSYVGYPNSGYNHSSSLTQNGKYLLFCDEVPAELPMNLVNVQNPGNFQPVNSFRPASRTTSHNPLIIGNKWAVVSCYQDGLWIFDISNPPLVTQLGFFDTYPQGGANIGSYPDNTYSGNWGAYPYLPSGIIIANDMQNGLFVLDPSAAYSNTLTNPVGLLNYAEKSPALNLFPNPAANIISLDYSGTQHSIIEIKSVYGQLIYRNEFEGHVIEKVDVRNFQNGTYLVTVSENGQHTIGKLIILH
ncbi:MAG: choice-of-anchor B family protein [bacterium]|nr:choice-of-anchor B family protein [bacterium]